MISPGGRNWISPFQHSGWKKVRTLEYDSFGSTILFQGSHAGPFGNHGDALFGVMRFGHHHFDPEATELQCVGPICRTLLPPTAERGF